MVAEATTERRGETTWCGLYHAALPVDEAGAFLRAPAVGGISLFIGTTRRWTEKTGAGGETAPEPRQTERLRYEAYEPMALEELGRLAATARRRWPVERCCLLHRLGEVPVAEASVVVGVGSGHRAAAFEASRWLIDTLKAEVPVWKREVFADGSEEWVEPKGGAMF